MREWATVDELREIIALRKEGRRLSYQALELRLNNQDEEANELRAQSKALKEEAATKSKAIWGD